MRNRSSEDVLCLGAYIKLSLYSSHPNKESSTEYVNGTVLTESEFRKVRRSESHTSFRGDKKIFIRTFSFCCSIQVKIGISDVHLICWDRKLVKICAWKATVF